MRGFGWRKGKKLYNHNIKTKRIILKRIKMFIFSIKILSSLRKWAALKKALQGGHNKQVHLHECELSLHHENSCIGQQPTKGTWQKLSNMKVLEKFPEKNMLNKFQHSSCVFHVQGIFIDVYSQFKMLEKPMNLCSVFSGTWLMFLKMLPPCQAMPYLSIVSVWIEENGTLPDFH